jgi:hypothetical protein
MKVLASEKIKWLAARNGWSLAQSEGFIEGDACRRRGSMPSKYAQIGIDEYSLGFRAGYYERRDPDSSRTVKPEALDRMRHSLRR